MSTIEKTTYGITKNGEKVTQFVLKNDHGIEMRVIEFGGIITHLFVPDKSGRFEDIVLGHDSLEDYETSPFFLGALIGRYANRIANGRFKLNGQEYLLQQNDGLNCLHGGSTGFHNQLWKGEPFEHEDGVGVILRYHSPDGEGGFPGAVDVEVGYLLTNDNSLEIEYRATPTAETVLNFTQHSYFNLSGMKEDILNHELTINSAAILPIDEHAIPLEEPMPVEGTPFDFIEPKKIGQDIQADHPQLKLGKGYDHTFILPFDGTQLAHVATVAHPSSGRTMEVWTTEPGIQFYSGNFLQNSPAGKSGTRNDYRMGFCLETQHFPNAPNRPDFPTTIFEAGEEYFSKTVFKFGLS